mmetsp:Transcript_16106/g.31520  ORF Transcript_16106/g.31520 Transcript_16106/m.31520 type:complete len:294 (+) Transcript_16106:1073-1954(+)
MRFVSMNSSNLAKSVASTSHVFPSPDALSITSFKVVPPLPCKEASRSWRFTKDASPQIALGGMPFSDKSIVLLSQTARSSTCSRRAACDAGELFFILSPLLKFPSCFMSSHPTAPVPMIPTANVMSDSVNEEWVARSARESSSRATTTEMLRSELPCAMAITLTFARPSAFRKRPEMPGWHFMPSPITAIMAAPPCEFTVISSCVASSGANAFCTLETALSSSCSSTATVMECSDEPWDIKITFTPTFPRASIILLATPGVPKKEAPEIVTKATLSIEVMAFTGKSLSSLVVS